MSTKVKFGITRRSFVNTGLSLAAGEMLSRLTTLQNEKLKTYRNHNCLIY